MRIFVVRFVLDQTVTVRFEMTNPWTTKLTEWATPELAKSGRTAGSLSKVSPLEWQSTGDADVLSVDNDLE